MKGALITVIITMIAFSIVLYWNKDTWGKGGGPGSPSPLSPTL